MVASYLTMQLAQANAGNSLSNQYLGLLYAYCLLYNLFIFEQPSPFYVLHTRVHVILNVFSHFEARMLNVVVLVQMQE